MLIFDSLQWIMDRSDAATQSFEKSGMARVRSDEGLQKVLEANAVEVGNEVTDLLLANRKAGHAPASARILICWDITAAKIGEAGGLRTRIDLLDVGGQLLPFVSFNILVLHVRYTEWPPPGTVERVEMMRGLAARSMEVAGRACGKISSKWEGLTGGFTIYGGCAWDLALHRWQGGQGDALKFSDIDSLADFFSASVRR